MGAYVDLAAGVVSMSAEKIRQLQECLIGVLEKVLTDGGMSAREWARIAGRAVSMQVAIPHTRVMTREIFRIIGPTVRDPKHWDVFEPATPRAVADVRWLLANVAIVNGSQIWRPRRVVVVHWDASLRGWGAGIPARGICREHMGRCGHASCAREAWPRDPSVLLNTFALTDGEKASVRLELLPRCMFLLELLGLWHGLRALREWVRGRVVHLRGDNSSAVEDIRNGGCWCPVRTEIVRSIRLWAIKEGVVFWVTGHTPSEENLADGLSRMEDRDDWFVKGRVFREAEARWGPHSIDRMADSWNTKLPRFDAVWLCPGVESVETFARDWQGENNWVVPPFRLIFDVLLHVAECQALATLVVPQWEGQPWWPQLEEMRVGDAFHIGTDAFHPGPSGYVEPWGSRAWIFLVVRVDGRRRRGFIP